MTNCPNCGAPIIGSVCEYCGTRHYDSSIDTRLLHLNEQIIMTRTQLSQTAQINYILQKMEGWLGK